MLQLKTFGKSRSRDASFYDYRASHSILMKLVDGFITDISFLTSPNKTKISSQKLSCDSIHTGIKFRAYYLKKIMFTQAKEEQSNELIRNKSIVLKQMQDLDALIEKAGKAK